MTNDTALARALDEASGRRGGEAGRLPAGLLAWARRLIAVRRAVLAAEPAPTAIGARARRAFEARGITSVLARLLFDSGAAAAAPSRGSVMRSRTRRYGTGGAWLDVDVRGTEDGLWVLQMAATGPSEDLNIHIELPDAETPLEVEIDAFGAGRVLLDGSVASVVLIVKSDGNDVLRTPPVPLA